MRGMAREGKELFYQFTLLHKEAGLEILEILAFYPHIKNITVLFMIQTSMFHTYIDGKAVF